MVNQMSEMEDQVARALRDKLQKIGYGVGTINAGQLADALARPAIESMRGPSRAICEVAWKETRGTLLEEGYADAVDEVELHFNAVIDAVLGEKK